MFIKSFSYFIFKSIFIVFILNIHFNNLEIRILTRKISINKYNFPNLNSINELFNCKITKNTVLIFEPFEYHYECSPGFSKYFIELGYNIHIIMHNSGLDSFCFFEPINKIRIFIYNKTEEVKKYAKNISLTAINYSYILIETANPYYFIIYKELNLFNINHSFFVFHHLNYVFSIPNDVKLRKNQIWSLGNFNGAIQVNPHYFGELKSKKRSKITKFFITSTIERNYKYLISAVEKLKQQNLEFHIIVVGKWNTFTYHNISEKVKDNFTFRYNISYSELYNEVINSDYIIINLDLNNIKDVEFKYTRVSGSIQLAYGFLKPVIINKDFAEIYNFNSDNSLIFENHNLNEVMRYAINLRKKNYKKMQENLRIIANKIYKDSLYNIKNCLFDF